MSSSHLPTSPISRSPETARERRYLAVWMPFLPDDRWRREASSEAKACPHPRVFTVKVKGATRIAALDQHASALGLARKMTLANARALLPHVEAIAHDPRANSDFLEALAEVMGDFTPSVAFDLPHGLMLDITGCAHLFGGERSMITRIRRALEDQGASLVRLASAPTPDMARALARFGQASTTIATDRSLVRALPVAAFEYGADDERALARAGLRTVADVADRPSVLFAARFTQAFTVKLSRLLGEEDCRITPHRPPPPLLLDDVMAEPVASHGVIETIIEGLFNRAAHELEARGEGGRSFTTTFFRTDGAHRRINIRTSVPTRDATLLQRLYRDRLDAIADPLDPGFGFDLIRLHIDRVEPMALIQNTLDANQESNDQCTELIDRLSTMFGGERISALRAVDTHVPERAQEIVHAAVAAPQTPWPILACPRPLHVFATPQSIDVQGEMSIRGAPPQAFVWRRKTHHTRAVEGPERIADEWWLTPSGFGTRDYYTLTTEIGQRFWVFRAHATTPSSPVAWFIHGVYP